MFWKNTGWSLMMGSSFLKEERVQVPEEGSVDKQGTND